MHIFYFYAMCEMYVCAPSCSDDVALIAYNPLDIQTMVDIAVDGYQLQPA